MNQPVARKELIIGARQYKVLDVIGSAVRGLTDYPRTEGATIQDHAYGLNWHTPDTIQAIIDELGNSAVLMTRDQMENNQLYRHFITYDIILRQPEDIESPAQVFVYIRNKKAGEQKLHGKASIGFGGHVELADIVAIEDKPSEIDLVRTLDRARDRELNGELELMSNIHGVTVATQGGAELVNNPARLIKSATLVDIDDVGMVHLGIANLYLLDPDTDADIPHAETDDEGAFRPYDPQGFHPLTPDLLQQFQFENWSKLLIESLINDDLLS
jgi:predicted NUDIX family phosphoesterase